MISIGVFIAALIVISIFSNLDYEKKFELQLDSGSFTPQIGFHRVDIIKKKTVTESENFFFLQTTHYLDFEEQRKLLEEGITLVDSLNAFVYVASASNTSLHYFQATRHPEIRSAIPIEPETKLDSNIQSRHIPPWVFKAKNDAGVDKIEFIVFFHKQLSAGSMKKIVNENKTSTVELISAVSSLLTFDQVTELAKHSAVKFIIYGEPEYEGDISESKRVANIPNFVDNSDLSGKGVVVLIFDEANIIDRGIGPHRDFSNVTQLNPEPKMDFSRDNK